jgi:hypothetical protein
VSCHRVIASDGTLGGFHGQRMGEMIEKKRALLKEERGLPLQKKNIIFNISFDLCHS